MPVPPAVPAAAPTDGEESEALATMLLVLAADGRIRCVNEAAPGVAARLGAGPVDPGRDALDLLAALGPGGSEVRERLQEVLTGARAQPAAVVGEVLVGGRDRVLRWSIQPLSGPEAGAAVLVEDITARRRADGDGRAEALDSARLALVARHIDDAIFISGPDGAISWVNDAFVRATGYPAAEVVGRRRLDLVRGPFTRTGQFRALAEDLDALRRCSAEFITRTRAGKSYWVQLEASPVLQDGAVVGLIGVERDVTERRSAQEQGTQSLRRAESLAVALQYEKRLLSTVLSTIPHVVWWKGTDLRYIGCNEAFLRLRGLGSEAEIIGRLEGQLAPYGEPVPGSASGGPSDDPSDDPPDDHPGDGPGDRPGDRPEEGADAVPAPPALGPQLTFVERKVLDTGEPVIGAKLVVGRPPRTFQVSVLPHLDSGSVIGVVGVGADITRATEMERQLAQTNRLESIGQLAAGIAHEINTPVQYASDNTRFAADTVGEVLSALHELEQLLAPPGAHGEDPVHAAAVPAGATPGDATSGDATPGQDVTSRLHALLDSLDLDFVSAELPSALEQSLEGLDRVSQIVRAMKEFSHPGSGRGAADLNRLVSSTAQVSRNEWKYVAELSLDLDPGLGLVSCFEGDIKQVVLNIIVNAAHAVEERRRQQDAPGLGSIRVATRRDGDEARIMVTDDGIGMDESTRERIFDPFFTTKEVGKGTGQGLSLAHATVVTKHHGRIEVESAPGQGTTFSIVLPVREPATEAGPPEGAAGPPAAGPGGPAGERPVMPGAGG